MIRGQKRRSRACLVTPEQDQTGNRAVVFSVRPSDRAFLLVGASALLAALMTLSGVAPAQTSLPAADIDSHWAANAGGGLGVGSLPGARVDSTSPMLVGAWTDLDGKDVTVNLQDDNSLQNIPDPAESDLLIELAVAPLHIEEGGASTLTATTKAGATYPQDRTVTLSFTGTATKDSDYTITSASITITAGQTSGTAMIEALADSVTEPTETIVITARHDSRIISAVTVTIQAEDGSGGSPGAFGVFEDVPAGACYESALEWMILYQITAGCTPTMFCPEQNVTRQQFVTFLWRAAGRPAAPSLGSQAFGDVREGGYAEESIGWAVANGVTKGCTPVSSETPTGNSGLSNCLCEGVGSWVFSGLGLVG